MKKTALAPFNLAHPGDVSLSVSRIYGRDNNNNNNTTTYKAP